MAVKQRKTVKPTSDASGFCAYIGPTIRGVIQHGTLYQGTKRETVKGAALSRAIGQLPMIADLIVPGESLGEARKKIKIPGNLLYVRYKALADQATKEEKT